MLPWCTATILAAVAWLGSSMVLQAEQAHLGPGSFEPAEWTQYPRGVTLLDEASTAVAMAWEGGLRRYRVTLGELDLGFLGQEEAWYDELSVRAAVELATRWDGGKAVVLAGSGSAEELARRVVGRRRIEVATLAATAAKVAKGRSVEADRGSLFLVARPNSKSAGPRNPVTQLQLVAARLHHAALVVLNPQLALPSPVCPGKTMPPSLLRDFEHVYVAEADALSADADAGIALYRRWPHPTYRLFERHKAHFAFLGSSPQRPSASQLEAIYEAATGMLDYHT